MKKLLLATSAMAIGLSAFGVMAGPLNEVNPALDDDIFVYWEEERDPAQDSNEFAPAPMPMDSVYNLGLIKDRNGDGTEDVSGDPASEFESRQPRTTRTVDELVMGEEALNMQTPVDTGYYIADNVASHPRGIAENDPQDTNTIVGNTFFVVAHGIRFINGDEQDNKRVEKEPNEYYGLERTVHNIMDATPAVTVANQISDITGVSEISETAQTISGELNGVMPHAPVENVFNGLHFALNADSPTEPDLPAAIEAILAQPDETPEGDTPFGIIDVTTSGSILEPDVGCTLLTDAINFDFGVDSQTGVSTPATVQITCGTGNEGDTLFRLSTTNQDPAGEGVDQQAASAYAVAMYNAAISGSESDPERQKNMTLVDVASGQAVATQTFAITNSGTAENIDLFAQLDDARHGGKPIPAGVADPENPAPFILNVWL